MVNLLGREGAEIRNESDGQALAALPGAHLHWYGKSQSSPGRKLGHLTLLLESSGAEALRREAMEKLEVVRAIWPLPQGGKLPLQ
jgi:5-(carboxyamino)imidazole ribonucleotide synthase